MKLRPGRPLVHPRILADIATYETDLYELLGLVHVVRQDLDRKGQHPAVRRQVAARLLNKRPVVVESLCNFGKFARWLAGIRSWQVQYRCLVHMNLLPA